MRPGSARCDGRGRGGAGGEQSCLGRAKREAPSLGVQGRRGDAPSWRRGAVAEARARSPGLLGTSPGERCRGRRDPGPRHPGRRIPDAEDPAKARGGSGPGARWRRSHGEGAFHGESEHVGRARGTGTGLRVRSTCAWASCPRRGCRVGRQGRRAPPGALAQRDGRRLGSGSGQGRRRREEWLCFPGGSAGRQQALVTCQPGGHLVLSAGGSAVTSGVPSSLDRGEMAAYPEGDRDASMPTHTCPHRRTRTRTHVHTCILMQTLHTDTRTCTHVHITRAHTYVHSWTHSHRHARVHSIVISNLIPCGNQ